MTAALVTAATLAAAPPAAAAEPTPTAFEATDRPSAYIGANVTLSATLRENTAEPREPVAGAAVSVQQLNAEGVVVREVPATTNAEGLVTHTFQAQPGVNRYQFAFAGSETHAASSSNLVSTTGVKAPTTLTLSGRTTVVDEQSVAIRIGWMSSDRRPVTGRVTLQWKPARTDQPFRNLRTVQVSNGVTTTSVRPRVDTVWRAVAPAGAWHHGDVSNAHRIDNRPPIAPVALPAGAPAPRVRLPLQARAVGGGVNARVSTIPSGVWRSMVGRSWHRGCPVGRADLRLVQLNYWGFDGYRYRGELVLHRTVVGDAIGVFRELYAGRFPVRRLYRVDRFGWSDRVQGANDYTSMAADNTSAFNCRYVVGRPGVRSPHSYGDTIDINPWENPYVSPQGTYPNTWWLSRSHRKVAWRSRSHPVVAIFRRHGFVWGGTYRDFHHFQS